MSTFASFTTLEAPQQPGTRTVIFLHGFGEIGDAWTDFVDKLRKFPDMQTTKFILPTAAKRVVTLWKLEGDIINAWYDIPSWNDIVHENNDGAGMISARDSLDGLIEEQIKTGTSPGTIFVGGFSQGGCLALLSAMIGRHASVIGGFFALSAYLPMIERIRDRIPERCSRQAPIFIGHGNVDPKVKWQWGERTFKAVKSWDYEDVEFHTYRDVFHQLCDEEVEDLVHWMSGRRLTGDGAVEHSTIPPDMPSGKNPALWRLFSSIARQDVSRSIGS